MPGCKCKICGKSLQGIYNRYGGQACAACAAFFIRAYNKKDEYVCKNENLCLAIPSQIGAKCQKCRLSKCLESGMQFSAFKGRNYSDEGIFKEYLIIAKKLFALLTIIKNDPQLLLNYYIKNDLKLLHEANSFDLLINSTAPTPSYVNKWATLFQSNQIPITEVHILFCTIISNLKFPWFSIQDQQMMAFFQRQACLDIYRQHTYSTNEIKEGFEKLASYFNEQFAKHFVTQQINNNNDSV
uniref:Nuclear receptor domain-containing protein n=1 Tax=Panagrolaimus davidi TaxID=227884 RepID=A0A914QVV0_9BILA